MPTQRGPIDARLPWSVRLFASAPPVYALAAAVIWSLGAALYCFVLEIPFWTTFAQVDLLQIWILSITPMVTVYALRGAERDLRDLRPVLRSPPDVSDPASGQLYFLGRGTLALIGAVGVAIATALLFAPGSWADGLPAMEHPNFAWAALRGGVLGWLVMRMIAIELAVGFGFSRLGEREAVVDWLDQRPLVPFARKGLRSVFLLLLYSFLFSLFLLEPWGRVIAVSTLVLFPAFCVAALLLPVWGVHRRLAAVKRAELLRVDAALRAEAEANLAAAGGAAANARLSNLVAYRGLVDAAGTWPFDLAIWLRFALYVTLGLGSWLGGALVERLLGAALD